MSRHQEGEWKESGRSEGVTGRKVEEGGSSGGSMRREASPAGPMGAVPLGKDRQPGPGINSTRQGRSAHDPPAALLTKPACHPSAGGFLLCFLSLVLHMFPQALVSFPLMSTSHKSRYSTHTLPRALNTSTFHINYF